MAFREGARQTGFFVAVSSSPDVCLTGPGKTPVPYQISAFFDSSANCSPNVRFKGDFAATKIAFATKVVGDEAGTGGGVKSGVNTNYAYPATYTATVRANGENVLVHLDTVMLMNAASKDSGYNTVGKLMCQDDMKAGPAPEAGKPDQTNPLVQPTEQEVDFLQSLEGKLKQLMESPGGIADLAKKVGGMAMSGNFSIDGLLSTFGGMFGGDLLDGIGGGLLGGGCNIGLDNFGSLSDIASLAQKGYELTQVDWDNPLAALSAISGVAGMGANFLNSPELAQLQGYVNMASMGVSLAQTDFSNAGSVLASLGMMTGVAGGFSKNPRAFATMQKLLQETSKYHAMQQLIKGSTRMQQQFANQHPSVGGGGWLPPVPPDRVFKPKPSMGQFDEQDWMDLMWLSMAMTANKSIKFNDALMRPLVQMQKKQRKEKKLVQDRMFRPSKVSEFAWNAETGSVSMPSRLSGKTFEPETSNEVTRGLSGNLYRPVKLEIVDERDEPEMVTRDVKWEEQGFMPEGWSTENKVKPSSVLQRGWGNKNE